MVNSEVIIMNDVSNFILILAVSSFTLALLIAV